jgi:hypothetical protein
MISMGTLLLLLLIAGVGGGIYFILRFMIFYPHKLILKEIVGSKQIITIKRLKITRNKEGIETWKTSDGLEVPIPHDPDCVQIDSKGKKIVTLYMKGNDIFYQLDKTQSKDLVSLSPYTQNQRAFHISQYKKSELDRNKGWEEHIPMIASAMVLIVIAVIGYLVFDEWTSFQSDFQDRNENLNNRLVDAIVDINEMNSDIQTIKSSVVEQTAGEVPN